MKEKAFNRDSLEFLLERKGVRQTYIHLFYFIYL